jgi:hypothetical protein
MSERSVFLLGDHVFIKLVSLNEDRGRRLAKALVGNEILPPFTSNEFLINYLIARDNEKILQGSKIKSDINTLLSPGTQVFVSGREYDISDMEKYKSMEYNNVVNDLEDNFTLFEGYLKNIRRLSDKGQTVRTAVIISKRVTGSYDDFLKINLDEEDFNKMIIDSLIHIMYLYHVYQDRYQALHGDPKIQNYTWLELDEPVDILYDFRDKYDDSNSRIIRRKGVKHIFYFTDLEFVYSPILKTVVLDGNKYYFNFDTNAAWYGEDDNEDRIFVPKISNKDPYELNFNLYGGYKIKPFKLNRMGDERMNDYEIYDWFGEKFPRMYTIDILTLIKMFLTYWYVSYFDGDVIRKLNMYFSQFVSLSLGEEDKQLRNKINYKRVSPGNAATLFGA